MSRRRIRQQWTHRRLGLGAAQPMDAALARTESLLAAVGARRTTTASESSDAFEAALFDYVCDVDLTICLPALEATPIPLAELRAAAPARRVHQRLTWRVLIPVATSGVAALAIAAAALLADTASPTSPALAATAESRQLLTHADSLLTAASHAAVTDRAKLVAEAKADLSHVSRLLPLAAPQSRPELRERMEALDERAKPLGTRRTRLTPAKDTDSTDDGPPLSQSDAPGTDVAPGTTNSATGTAGGGDQGRPTRQRPVRRPPTTDADSNPNAGAKPPAAADRRSAAAAPVGLDVVT